MGFTVLYSTSFTWFLFEFFLPKGIFFGGIFTHIYEILNTLKSFQKLTVYMTMYFNFIGEKIFSLFKYCIIIEFYFFYFYFIKVK